MCIATGGLWAQAAETFAPVVVRAGVAETAGATPQDEWGKVLPDLPFSVERGYGYIGGEAGRVGGATEAAAAARGGSRDWPLAWRQGALKYSFRVPRGVYLLRLGFLETEVAQAGLRVFDVYVEDQETCRHVDVCGEAGDFAWLVRNALVSVLDGWLDVRLVSVTGDRPPRVSRLGIQAVTSTSAFPAPLVAPQLSGRGAYLRNVLRWPESPDADVVGYGLFRADSPEGPFESVTLDPIQLGSFVDWQARPGHGTYYKLRAYGLDGGQSPLSPALRLEAAAALAPQKKLYDLRLPQDALVRISSWRTEDLLVDAELSFHGRRLPIEVGYACGESRWQRRKSIRIDMARDPHRLLQRRGEILLSAEAGDFTQLREKLCSEADALVGLASPLVEPVFAAVNGQFLGVRWDVERMGARFRRRAGLDEVGLLARLGGPDHWRADWEPRGVQIGAAGDITALDELVRQLSLIHEGEVEAFFETHFYLDRLIDRMAVAAIRGAVDVPLDRLYLLRDSRNGKWEILRQDHRHGDWGIRDFTTELHDLSPAELERSLFPWAQRCGRSARKDWLVLTTRFFKVEALRRRYLDRVRALLGGELSPEEVDGLVDKAFSEVRDAVLEDGEIWPNDGGKAFLDGPERIQAAHRRRVAALDRLLNAEEAREAEALAIEEILLRPSVGNPWLRVRSRSGGAVKLGDYRFSESFERTGRVIEAVKVLAPGESHVVELRAAAARSAGGGPFVLWREDGGGGFVVSDFVFAGYSPQGLVYARSDGAPGGWSFRKESDAGVRILPPPFEHRAGVEREKSGDLTPWIQPLPLPSAGAAEERWVLRYREESKQMFDEVALGWDEKELRFEVTLQKGESRPRTAYYFLRAARDGGERAFPLGAPELTWFLPVLPPLSINEVCPRPARGAEDPGEFIEVYNDGDQPVSLRGYYLSDDRRNALKWRITEDVVVKPKGYALFQADGLNRGTHTSFRLSNSGEYVGLSGPPEEGGLLIDAMTFPAVPPGQSWGRAQDGTKATRAWKDPTPGARNLPKIPKEILEKQD